MDIYTLLDCVFNVAASIFQAFFLYYTLTPKYKMYICVLPLSIISIPAYISFKTIFSDSSFLAFVQLLYFAMYFVAAFVFYSDKVRYKLGVSLFMFFIYIGVDMIASCIISMLFGMDALTTGYSRTIGFVIATVLLVMFYVAFVNIYKKFKKKDHVKNLGMFMLFPISQIILLIGVLYGFRILYNDPTSSVEISSNDAISWLAISIIGCAISAAADIILYFVLKETSKNEELKDSLKLANYRGELELQYYQQMQENIEETRKIRHDFYNILATMNASGEISAKLRGEIEAALRRSSVASFCENKIVNLIVISKNKICAENGINLNADLEIPEDISVSQLDLLRVFSNILDNAIEENLKSKPDDKRYIMLNAKIRDNYLYISANNPLNSTPIKKNGSYSTTKAQKNQHGLGMTILNDIAKKYSGDFIAENDKESFTSLVSLRIS